MGILCGVLCGVLLSPGNALRSTFWEYFFAGEYFAEYFAEYFFAGECFAEYFAEYFFAGEFFAEYIDFERIQGGMTGDIIFFKKPMCFHLFCQGGATRSSPLAVRWRPGATQS